MGLFGGIKRAFQELYIARPDDAVSQVIWRYPSQTIPNGAKLTVRSDEVAIFFREGRFGGALEAGTYKIDSDNIPFIGNWLVSGFTGGNHYLAELFFVRRAEFLHESGRRELGTFPDMESHHLLGLHYQTRVAMRVEDPLALIAELGGQWSGAHETVTRFVDARLRSLLSAVVGQLATEQPILQLTTNAFNEQIGQLVVARAQEEFAPQGLLLTRFLELTLTLDDHSHRAVREFGEERARLNLEREGAQIAGSFANYQIAKGQRAVLEGMASGLERGVSGPGVGLGLSGGSAWSPGPSRQLQDVRATGARAADPPPPARAQLPAAQLSWYLQTGRGQEGPYTMRQLVLRAVAERLDEHTAMVRAEGDPAWFVASSEDALVREFERRRGPAGPAPSSALAAHATGVSGPNEARIRFDAAMSAALADGVLTREECDLLGRMAVEANLAGDFTAAFALVEARARAAGARIEPATAAVPTASEPPPPPPAPGACAPPPPPPPPPPTVTTYSYFDGAAQLAGLTAAEVAQRYRANPAGYHVVYTPALGEWRPAADVPDIRGLLG